MGVQPERGFAGNRLQGAKRLKVGGRLLQGAGGEALSQQAEATVIAVLSQGAAHLQCIRLIGPIFLRMTYALNENALTVQAIEDQVRPIRIGAGFLPQLGAYARSLGKLRQKGECLFQAILIALGLIDSETLNAGPIDMIQVFYGAAAKFKRHLRLPDGVLLRGSLPWKED